MSAAETMNVDTVPANPPAGDTRLLFQQDLERNIRFIKQGVASLEARYIHRVLRTIPSTRKRLDTQTLGAAIQKYYRPEFGDKEELLGLLHYKVTEGMDLDAKPVAPVKEDPEISVYLGLLVLIHLLDQKAYDAGQRLATALVDRAMELNRRTLDAIVAKLFFYYARFYEITGRLADVRPALLTNLRTATLRRDSELQATLINLILRNLLHFNLYEQADKLAAKTAFPDNASNNQMARHMYYLGRIKAIQLDYTAAHTYLLQAQRKAPQTPTTAGFQQTVGKLFVIVQLLMGEIPERALFRQPVLRKPLAPYLAITQAVRVGDLAKFQATVARFDSRFRADHTSTLIVRLRHNVIKTGIRMISLSYLRISLRDICIKLHLDSEEDAEYIVSKAIRDGVIDATIDHERGFVQSKEVADVYATSEPQAAFNQRIQFCLNLYNESVKALRFPLNAHKKDLESASEALERERELAKEIAQSDFDADSDNDMGL
ncbi:26S proteasome non-ATPase regulatory subunit [Tieghemiomyces parasiticus]|uniref:26S proteasome regulatory subunit RPN3 n=1 Tax=Tieghemiomyces parasiticus TaxID=78921 RepID=A0A9W8AIG1_9FUNG|nr:26S proteasome non-ATPase regulatory subunit [Tieghemiomyces parasiticus]